MESAFDQLLAFVRYRCLLIQHVSEINHGLPLSGQEPKARQILCERNIYVRVIGCDLALERVDSKDGLFWRKPQDR